MAETKARTKLQWEGAAQLKRLLVPVDEVSPHPENPRRGNVALIADSLRERGQTKPIVVSKATGYIIAGNHTYRAAVEELGWNKIAAVVIDFSPQEEVEYLLADNRTSDVGTYEIDVQLKLLNELMETGRLEASGYDADAVEDLVSEHDRILEAARQASDARHSETDAEIEAREQLRAGSRVMREVVLTYSEDKHERFIGYLKALKKEYGTTGVMDTVFQAIERAAKAL